MVEEGRDFGGNFCHIEISESYTILLIYKVTSTRFLWNILF